jgi:hypothetical protein
MFNPNIVAENQFYKAIVTPAADNLAACLNQLQQFSPCYQSQRSWEPPPQFGVMRADNNWDPDIEKFRIAFESAHKSAEQASHAFLNALERYHKKCQDPLAPE